MIIAEPVNMVVPLAEARNAARINGADSDAEIELYVRALTAKAEHEIGRAIIDQTHRETMDGFDGPIELTVVPVQSVVIKYLDVDGDEMTLDPQDYILDNARTPAVVVPAPGKDWPETFDRINSVTVDALCGYGPDDSTAPAVFKGYILAKVREYFAPAGTPESPYLSRLLDSLRVY
ncbi:MAG: head-tail connector protein [Telluria sp.]